MKKRVNAFLFICAAWAVPLSAQGPTFDTSGDGKLIGTYYFRHVLYGISTQADSSGITGDITEAIAVFGTITFNGNGTSSINALVSDSYVNEQNGQISQIPLSCYIAGTVCSPTSGAAVAGTYSLSASGFGFMANPITGDQIEGSLSANNVFVGSSTEASETYNDLFIAAFIPTPAPGNSSFSGTYTAAGFFPGSSPLSSEDAFFQLTPNGAGSLGSVTVGGYTGNGSTVTQAPDGNVTYSFSNGAAVVTFPVNNQTGYFFPGGAASPEYFYFSPDGNFFFGGSPTGGYDMIVGVKNASGNQNFSGLYYQAGIDQDDSNLSGGYADFDGYYGSLNATSSGDILEHQRVSTQLNGVFGSTFADSFTPPITGNYTDTAGYEQYAFGGDGVVRIGEGVWPYMGIQVAVQAPSFSGPGVYLSPAGIVNAASFSPFTAGVSNGEMVTLFGSGLAPGNASAPTLPLPTSQGLDGVTVQVNGAYAPINYVSPGQILVNVPYEASLACGQSAAFCFAQFIVTNNGVASNPVTLLLNGTTPGVFTSAYGLGYGYVQHSADYSLVTPSNPAQPGETVIAYVSGLGNVSPTVTDGAAAPGGVQTSNAIAADVGGAPATVTFAGLVPTLAGLYQVNLTLASSGMTAGDNTLDISGPDSYASQALISIGSGATAAFRKPAAKTRPQARAKADAKRKPFCPTTLVKSCQAE